MRRAGITLMFTMLSILTNAKDSTYPRLTYGVEWSYVGTAFSAYHHNFYDIDGYKVNISDFDTLFDSNGEVMVHIGYNINHLWNISAFTGLTGMINYHNSVPLNVRLTRFYGDNALEDRWFTYIDTGTGVTLKKPVQANLSAKFGGGYRISLSKDSKIDFHADVRSVFTQPHIYYYEELVNPQYVNRNDALLISIAVGMSLIF